MPGLIRIPSRASRSIALSTLPAVDSIVDSIHTIDLDEFRQRAFIPEKPITITTRDGRTSKSANTTSSLQSLPAAEKWFSQEPWHTRRSWGTSLSQQYLSHFRDTILPYELIIDLKGQDLERYINWARAGDRRELAAFLAELLSQSGDRAFRRFNAPLSLFLQACRSTPSAITPPRLYIAQAQIADLPKQLQNDLPTPRIVKEAGKGDIYDANIWIGIPPTYTPLHKDPNPNLFVQLASSKRVRLFEPTIGSAIFRDVQQKIGQYGSASFRGDEMMEGPERNALDEAIWGNIANREGFEAVVLPGDALFIPKGWWHSIKSIGSDISASVNWWFR